MTDDLTDLEALAQAATRAAPLDRSPRLVRSPCQIGETVCDWCCQRRLIASKWNDAYCCDECDALVTFTALAHPGVVLALIARVRKAEAERDEARAALVRVEALAEEYARNGAERLALGKVAWPNNVARDIRAALAGGDDRG